MPGSSYPIPDDTLLLCIDMQPKFLAAVQHGVRVRRRCEFAVAAAVGIGLPVAFTEQVPEKLGNTVPELTALAPGASAWTKTTFSALADDGIRDALLCQRKIQHVLLCGIETSVCIYQTAIGARAEDLAVTVLSDAIGARREEDARTCLDALQRAGVHVLPAETVLYALLHDVRHPFFRGYTQLVKLHDAVVSV
jgi:nicotinamidase-related amidase